MRYPYNEKYDHLAELKLVKSATEGSGIALEKLIQLYQSFIYNIAFRMVLSPHDAEDITQEILIKIVTRLNTFRGESSFRTWVNRITVNHILNMKKKWLEERYQTREMYEEELDHISIEELYGYSDPEKEILFEEARLGCLAGMLLCLTREQRIVFIMGEIFSVPGEICAEVLEISHEAYRKKLSRARADLYQFMNEKCGLVNLKNPCRCKSKTKGFIEAGWVDPQNMKFYSAYSKKIFECVGRKDSKLKKVEGFDYQYLLQEFPYTEKIPAKEFVERLFKITSVESIFDI